MRPDRGDGQQEHLALLIIDLDDFKQVNDVYAHAAGDELLVQVSRRLVEVAGGRGVPARFGGDEFALLLSGLGEAGEADELAERLRVPMLEPFRLARATVSVGASVGVAAATPALTAGDLVRCADIAIYAAKGKGKNRVERFDSAHRGDIARLPLLEEHLAEAVDRDEIVLHYQPQIDLRSGTCAGVEALVRCNHPTMGALGPGTFIPLAERTGQTACSATTSSAPPASRSRAGAGCRRPASCVWPSTPRGNWPTQVRGGRARGAARRWAAWTGCWTPSCDHPSIEIVRVC